MTESMRTSGSPPAAAAPTTEAAPAPRVGAAPRESASRQSAPQESAPRVWLLMGDRAGDNSQILGLGEALGWPLEIQRFVYKRYERLVNFPFTTTLAGVDLERSSQLGPP